MTSIKKNISKAPLKLKKQAKIALVQSEYNADITDALAKSCHETLAKAGLSAKNILMFKVPGAWELPIACQKVATSQKPDAIIGMGLILKGETPHFDFISAACAQGMMEVGLKFDLPVIFGVLTTNTLAQAKARIKGGKRGDKGVEVAHAAIKMLNEYS